MHLNHATLLFFAAIVGGALNSVAGGGGFICFPALIFTGMPPVNANATNTVALWPGTVAATGAYRRELTPERRQTLLPLFLITVAGGLMGAVLLLKTSQSTFMRLVPWLLLMATLLFTFGGRLTGRIHQRGSDTGEYSRRAFVTVILLQLPVAIYIGYFGAGAGILILAVLALMGMENIHAMNGVKTLLTSIANGVAVLTFIAARAVIWPQALLMLVGAILGGYGGAWYAQKLNPRAVRYFVIAVGFAMTGYFFWRA